MSQVHNDLYEWKVTQKGLSRNYVKVNIDGTSRGGKNVQRAGASILVCLAKRYLWEKMNGRGVLCSMKFSDDFAGEKRGAVK